MLGVQRRALWIAFTANAALLIVQLVAGIVFGSLALLADTAHLASDVAALAIALIAQQLASRPASARHTYGLQRAEVLGAQVNALVLLVVTGWLLVEAIRRLGDARGTDGIGMIVVAVLGLAVNAGSAVIVHRVAGANLNLRGAFLHLASDALGSLGVLVAGIAIAAWSAAWADPVASMLICVLVIVAALRLLRDATAVLLEGAPAGLETGTVEDALRAVPGVEAVHHLHVWSIGSETPALSAHVVLSDTESLHDAQVRGDALKALLADRFGIDHATLELECHPCGDAEPGTTSTSATTTPPR